MSASAVTQAEKAGAAPYSRALLAVYDTVVLRWSNTLVWRCPSERGWCEFSARSDVSGQIQFNRYPDSPLCVSTTYRTD